MLSFGLGLVGSASWRGKKLLTCLPSRNLEESRAKYARRGAVEKCRASTHLKKKSTHFSTIFEPFFFKSLGLAGVRSTSYRTGKLLPCTLIGNSEESRANGQPKGATSAHLVVKSQQVVNFDGRLQIGSEMQACSLPARKQRGRKNFLFNIYRENEIGFARPSPFLEKSQAKT